MRHGSSLSAILLSSAVVAAAQPVVSLQPGLFTFGQGEVVINDVVMKPGAGITHWRQGRILQTGDGAAELVLGKRARIWAGRYSRLRFVSSDPNDLVVELLAGAAALEVTKVRSAERVRVLAGGREIELTKRGVMRADAQPSEAPGLRVLKGRARVEPEGEEVRAGEAFAFTPMGAPTDAENRFDAWVEMRRRQFLLARIEELMSGPDAGMRTGPPMIVTPGEKPVVLGEEMARRQQD